MDLEKLDQFNHDDATDIDWLHAYLASPTTDPDLLEMQRTILNHARHIERATGLVVVVNPKDDLYLQAVIEKTDVERVIVLASENEKWLQRVLGQSSKAFVLVGDPRDAEVLEGIKESGRPNYLFIDGNQEDDPDYLPDLAAALSAELMPREAGWCGQEKEFARWAIYGAKVKPSVSALVHFFDEYAVPGACNTAYIDLIKPIYELNMDEIHGLIADQAMEMVP